MRTACIYHDKAFTVLLLWSSRSSSYYIPLSESASNRRTRCKTECLALRLYIVNADPFQRAYFKGGHLFGSYQFTRSYPFPI